MAEHGFSNDVEADRVLGGHSPKPDATRPGDGKLIEIAPHAQCRFAVSVSPAKLMAGQTGTATIVMVLEADSVMESPGDLRIVPPKAEVAGKSLLQLGAAVVRPPQSTNLATAYRGQQVYDNWATVDLPITMSTAAAMGSIQAIDVEAHFRLHEGSTGRLFGEFCNPLTITCEVGSVPDPAVRPSSSHAGTDLVADEQPTPEAKRLRAEQPAIVAASPEAAAEANPTENPGRPASLSGELAEAADNEELLLFLLGAGLLAAVALLLIVRRR